MSGRPVRLSPLERTLIALLGLTTGRMVPVDRIVDVLWGQESPGSVRNRVHALASGLRRALGTAGVVVTEPSRGYRLDGEACRVDLVEFERLTGRARRLAAGGERAEAAELFRAALALWRGEPLVGVAALYPDAVGLAEARMAVLHERIDLDLSLGRHTALIGELTALSTAHPAREQLTTKLMLALYRSGRQAEALAVFGRARSYLAEELGLEPGAELVRLHERILRRDPGLDAAAEEPASGAAGRPAQLPLDLPDFAGRSGDVDQVMAHLRSCRSVAISAIDGMAGIGKTALAVHVGHRLVDQFPDGQLFLDLRAYTAGADPMEPGEALDFLLRSIGVPRERIPDGVDERAALWRTALARRRLLVVLDNAATADQLRPLVPGTGESAVLITSRQRLTALDGSHSHSVDLLPAAEAAALFRAVAGSRAAAEPEAVAEVVRLCGRLPLAIRIAAARLHSRPQWAVADLVDRLRRHRRLAELSVDGRGLEPVLALSYLHLGPAERRLYRLLSLHPGGDFDAYTAAALADVPVEKADALLESLLDIHFVTQHTAGRYRFHDLLREYALATAEAEEPEAAHVAALDRLLDYYLHTVNAASDLVEPTRRLVEPLVTQKPAAVPSITELAEALSWLDSERANLMAVIHHAAVTGRPHHAWQLTHAVRPYYTLQGRLEEIQATHGDALRAARDIDDRWAEATTLNDLGTLLLLAGRVGDALDRCQRSLALHSALGDRDGMASALVNLGGILADLNRADEALDHCQRGHDLFEEIGDVHRVAAALGNLGSILTDLGRYPEALDHLQRSLVLCRESGQRRNEAALWGMIGVVQQKLADIAAAIDANRQARAICREIGDRSGEARRLVALGELYHAAGDPTRARGCLEEALTIARQVGNRWPEARAHEGLGALLAAGGDTEGAAHRLRQAVAIYTELANPRAAEVAVRLRS